MPLAAREHAPRATAWPRRGMPAGGGALEPAGAALLVLTGSDAEQQAFRQHEHGFDASRLSGALEQAHALPRVARRAVVAVEAVRCLAEQGIARSPLGALFHLRSGVACGLLAALDGLEKRVQARDGLARSESFALPARSVLRVSQRARPRSLVSRRAPASPPSCCARAALARLSSLEGGLRNIGQGERLGDKPPHDCAIRPLARVVSGACADDAVELSSIARIEGILLARVSGSRFAAATTSTVSG